MVGDRSLGGPQYLQVMITVGARYATSIIRWLRPAGSARLSRRIRRYVQCSSSSVFDLSSSPGVSGEQRLARHFLLAGSELGGHLHESDSKAE